MSINQADPWQRRHRRYEGTRGTSCYEKSNNQDRMVAKAIDPGRKAQYGQFFTLEEIARLMAKLFPQKSVDTCRLLDAPGLARYGEVVARPAEAAQEVARED